MIVTQQPGYDIQWEKLWSGLCTYGEVEAYTKKTHWQTSSASPKVTPATQ